MIEKLLDEPYWEELQDLISDRFKGEETCSFFLAGNGRVTRAAMLYYIVTSDHMWKMGKKAKVSIDDVRSKLSNLVEVRKTLMEWVLAQSQNTKNPELFNSLKEENNLDLIVRKLTSSFRAEKLKSSP